jgi:hypothetical protein
LFPIVGFALQDGYTIVILKDIWNLFPNVTCINAPDLDSGQCRIIKLKIEEIIHYFDMIVISRFPDNVRLGAKLIKLKPWKTGLFMYYSIYLSIY